MMLLNFSTGDAVELRRGSKKYRTLVENLLGEDSILVYMPIERGRVVLIQESEELEVIFVNMDKTSEGYVVQSFNAVVESRFIQDNIHMMRLRALNKPKKIQRRDFYRLNIVKPLLIEKPDSDTSIEVTTKDISAGGMLCISPVKLEIGDEYLIYVNINPLQPIIANGKVLSSDKEEDASFRYTTRFFFSEIDKNTQGQLLKQITEIQLMELRRRKNSAFPNDSLLLSHIDSELLSRYSEDSEFDQKIRYLQAFMAVLTLLIGVFLLLSHPNTGWNIPMFGAKTVKAWNAEIIKMNTFASLSLFILSGIAIVMDRTRYQHSRRINLINVFFAVVALLSLIFHIFLIANVI